MLAAILQARTGSTRLPGKTLLPLGGMPMLAYILRRLRAVLPELPVIVATTTQPGDDRLVELCASEGVPWFRGSEADVLRRYHDCASTFGLTHIIRLTADNPFGDHAELERLIALHLASGADYTHSFGQLPVGAAAEIFTFPCLAQAHREGREPHHREHVNEYVLEHPELFRIQALEVPPAKRQPGLRLTVDTLEDYARAQRIVAKSGSSGPWVNTEDAVAWLLQSA